MRSMTDEGRVNTRASAAFAAPSPDLASRGHPLPRSGRGIQPSHIFLKPSFLPPSFASFCQDWSSVYSKLA